MFAGNAFPVNSSTKEILRTTHVSLLLISLLDIFQQLKNVMHNRKKWRIGPFCIVYPVQDLLLEMWLIKLVVLA